MGGSDEKVRQYVFIMPKCWERFWYLQKCGRYNHIKIFLENLIFFAYEKEITTTNIIMSNLEIQLRNNGLKNFELFWEIAISGVDLLLDGASAASSAVLDLSGEGVTPSGASQPYKFSLTPNTGLVKNSQKYIADPPPPWFYHKLSTGHQWYLRYYIIITVLGSDFVQ